MYFIDFFKKVFKVKNIGIIIWIIVNLYIIIAFFPTTQGVSNSSEALVAVIRGIVIYAVSVTLALSPIGESIFRSMNGCREISDSVIFNRLTSLFNEVYEKANLKDSNLSQSIKLYMVEQQYPNAFALGRNTICVTSGLMCLNDDEIKGIFAHEFAHLSNKDTDITLFIYVGNLIASIMFLILRVVLFILSFFLGALSGKRNGAARGFVLAAGLDMLYMTIVGLYTKLGIILVNYSSRNHEFEADKFAYNLGYGKELRDALTTLQGEKIKPSGIVANLMSTHPETYLRIEKLNQYLSGIFDDDSNSSIDENSKTSNAETDTDTFDKFERNAINPPSDNSNETEGQAMNNGITFIDNDISDVENNIASQKTINKNLKMESVNSTVFNKKEKIYSLSQSETTIFSKNNSLDIIKNNNQKTENAKTDVLSSNQNSLFNIGLFILSLGLVYFEFPFALIMLTFICFRLNLYELGIKLGSIGNVVADKHKIFYQIRIDEIIIVFFIILLVLLIARLLEKNQLKELKRINYLSSIIGCSIGTISLFHNIYSYDVIYLFMIIFLIISIITNGTIIFIGKKTQVKDQ